MRLVSRYHMVKNSPYPLLISIELGIVMVGVIHSMHIDRETLFQSDMKKVSMVVVVYIIIAWLGEVNIENLYQGEHTKVIRENIMNGFIWFIVSEVAIFASLFFTYFYLLLIPSVELGSSIPPAGIEAIAYKGIPILNTVILVSSSITITSTINAERKDKIIISLVATTLLNTYFSTVQYIEYSNSPYNITDSSYGSIINLITGVHTSHVILGTFMVIGCIAEVVGNGIIRKRKEIIELTSIYLHFVDAIYINVFMVIYVWGS